jgi:hypothetical protein
MHICASCTTIKSWNEGFELVSDAVGTRESEHTKAKRAEAAQVHAARNTPASTTDDATTTTTDATTTTEGFQMGKVGGSGPGPNNAAYGPEFSSSKSPGYIMNPTKWTSIVDYNTNQNNHVDINKNLDIFADMDFSPNCCPNSYSSSMGCACMSQDTNIMLKQRGGNNVPFSQY